MSCHPRNGSHNRPRPQLTLFCDTAFVEAPGNQPDITPRSYDVLSVPQKLRCAASPETAVINVPTQIPNSAAMLTVTRERKSTNPLPRKLRCDISSPKSYDHGGVRELAVPRGYDTQTKHMQCHPRQCSCAESLDRSPRKVTLCPRNVVIFPPKSDVNPPKSYGNRFNRLIRQIFVDGES
jgi:hypothetical protein